MNDITGRQRQAETFNRAQSSAGLRCSKSLSPTHQERESHYCANNEPKCSNGYLLDIYPFVLVYRIGSYFFAWNRRRCWRWRIQLKIPIGQPWVERGLKQRDKWQKLSPRALTYFRPAWKYHSTFRDFQFHNNATAFSTALISEKRNVIRCHATSDNLPPPPSHKKEKKYEIFLKKQQLVKRLHGKQGLFPSSYDTRPAYC